MRATWLVVMCGVAGLVMTTPAAARDQAGTLNGGAPVEFQTEVLGVREVPAGNPLAGLHIDVKVKNAALDVYIAPMDFAMKFGVKVAKGDEVLIQGTQLKAGENNVVLAKAITTGVYVKGVFKPTLTVFLRNEDGPFWVDNASVGP